MPRFTAALAAALLASAVLAPAPALALTKEEAAAAWVARAKTFIAVVEDPTTNGDNILRRQKEACRGLLGERLRMGGYWPLWAAESMGSFCRALDGFNGASLPRDACRDLKSAQGYFSKAKPFGGAEEVVPTAARMAALISVMREGARGAGFGSC